MAVSRLFLIDFYNNSNPILPFKLITGEQEVLIVIGDLQSSFWFLFVAVSIFQAIHPRASCIVVCRVKKFMTRMTLRSSKLSGLSSRRILSTHLPPVFSTASGIFAATRQAKGVLPWSSGRCSRVLTLGLAECIRRQ